MLPEWAPQRAVLLAWPHADTDWQHMLDDARDCFCRIVRAISERAQAVIVSPDADEPWQQLAAAGADMERVKIVQMPTNDTWARDFGPISVEDGAGQIHALDYRFNGWGLKFASDKDNLVTSRLLSRVRSCPQALYEMRQAMVLEGGSIDVDDRGVMLTTSECLLSPNRNPWLTRDEIESRLVADFGLSRVVWLEHGALAGDDTDSHVDTLARFLPGGIVACSACDRPDDDHYACLSAMSMELRDKLPECRLVELPIPQPVYDAAGMRLPATYANFLILNGAVFLPVYGDEHYDKIAVERLAAELPDYEIVPVNCSALIEQHGSLHCVTMQLPFVVE